MRIKPTPKEEKEVREIMNKSRDVIYDTLIKLIRRIDYLEGEEFYLGIRKDILKRLRKGD